MPNWNDYVRRHLSLPSLTTRRETELIEEVARQLEDFYREARGRGLSDADAEMFARKQIRDWESLSADLLRTNRRHTRSLTEQVLDSHSSTMRKEGGITAMVWNFIRDMRFGARQLRRNPGFTLVAVLTLALGIGANTAVFSVVQSILLQPFPYTEPEELVIVFESAPTFGLSLVSLSAPDIADYRDQSSTLDGFGAFTPGNFNLTGEGEARRLHTQAVSHDLFPVLGVAPAHGRLFAPEEGIPGNERVAILSHSLWSTQFGADPEVVGRTIMLDGESYEVVGIMREAFLFPPPYTVYERIAEPAEIFVPLAFSEDDMQARLNHNWYGLARMKDGVTFDQARADLETINRGIGERYGERHPIEIGVAPALMADQVVGSFRGALLVLLAAVGGVLLIACANVAGLLLVRATGRQREIAVRAALGASRARIAAQLVSESLLLAVLGGFGGVALGWAAVAAVPALSPGNIPRLDSVSLDPAVLGYTAAITLLSGLFFGLAPAWQGSRIELNQSLKECGRGSGDSAGRGWLRGALVTGQIALATMLLISTGLLIGTFYQMRKIDVGFDPSNVLTMNLSLPAAKYPSGEPVRDFYRRLQEAVEAVPGVESASFIRDLPLTGEAWETLVSVEGEPHREISEKPVTAVQSVLPGAIETMRIRLLQGRTFDSRDTPESQPVAIVSRTFAHRVLPGKEPLGQRIRLGVPDEVDEEWMTVIGVTADIQGYNLTREIGPHIYLPHEQRSFRTLTLIARSAGVPPETLAAPIKSRIAELDPQQPVSNIQTMDQLYAESLAQPRFTMMLLAVFAGVALLLSLIGIYGVISHAVRQRTHEIGIRMVMGARSGDILRMVLRTGLVLTAAGLLAGLAGAYAATRLMSSLLYGVSATDPLVFAVVPVALAATALLACYLPARRAAKVDPMVALRYE